VWCRSGEQFYNSVAEAALEGRYHYLATSMFAPLLALLVGRHAPGAFLGERSRLPVIVIAGLVTTWYAVAVGAVDPLDPGRKPFRDVQRMIQSAIDLASPGSEVQIANRRVGSWAIAWGLPGPAGVFIITYPENTVDQKRIYFVETNAHIRETLERQEGTRIADLIARPRPDVGAR